MLHHGMAAGIVTHLEAYVTSLTFIIATACGIKSEYLNSWVQRQISERFYIIVIGICKKKNGG
jgi:heme/copper-type cytochrome/quinol oxidase subunit 1